MQITTQKSEYKTPAHFKFEATALAATDVMFR